MQPTLVQVPPGAGLPSAVFQSSTQAVLNPSCAARIAAMYPPGPAPMTTTSNVSDMLVGSHPNELYTNDYIASTLCRHSRESGNPASLVSNDTGSPLSRGRRAFVNVIRKHHQWTPAARSEIQQHPRRIL